MDSHQLRTDSSKAEQVSQLNFGTPETFQLPTAKRRKRTPTYGREILEDRNVDIRNEPFPIAALATMESFSGTVGVQEGRAMARQTLVDILIQFDHDFLLGLENGVKREGWVPPVLICKAWAAPYKYRKVGQGIVVIRLWSKSVKDSGIYMEQVRGGHHVSDFINVGIRISGIDGK